MLVESESKRRRGQDEGRAGRGGGGRADRSVGRVRGQLRSREPAPDQRLVRRAAKLRAGPAIAAQIPTEEIGGQYFQETHPQELFRECSVFCESAGTADQVPRLVEIAMRAALERGGVAVVVIPGDMFLTKSLFQPGVQLYEPAASRIQGAERGLD